MAEARGAIQAARAHGYLHAMDEFTGFGAPALTFLRRLARNNRRDWFEEHRADYERQLAAPLRALIEEVDVRLARFAPEFVGDPRRSPFRIHRDVRFSNDKRPYKTNIACRFFHRDAGARVSDGESSAGFYFQLGAGAGETFVAAGLWAPPSPALAAVRRRLDEDLEGFERIVLSRAFREATGTLDEELMLKRLPRGVAPGHPAERWLRYKSFTVTRELTEDEALGPALPDVMQRYFQATLPLVRWLNAAVGLRAHSRR